MNISVIIPVYNEEQTVASVVEVVRTWPRLHELVVVNDGSSDKSLAALKPFGTRITVITYKKNQGKGYALMSGIQHTTGEIIVFVDSDLVGLSHHDLDTLVAPIEAGKADMVLGLTRLWASPKKKKDLFDKLTGERVVLRQNIAPYIDQMATVGYGIELFLNDIHKDKRVVKVKLPYVSIIGKFHKHSMPAAVRSYMKEARELITQTVRQQADDLTPQAKKLFNGLQQYLKQMMDSL